MSENCQRWGDKDHNVPCLQSLSHDKSASEVEGNEAIALPLIIPRVVNSMSFRIAAEGDLAGQ